MLEEKLKAFLETVKDVTILQGKPKAGANTNTVSVIAKVAGFGISAEYITTSQLDLSDKSWKEFDLPVLRNCANQFAGAPYAMGKRSVLLACINGNKDSGRGRDHCRAECLTGTSSFNHTIKV